MEELEDWNTEEDGTITLIGKKQEDKELDEIRKENDINLTNEQSERFEKNLGHK